MLPSLPYPAHCQLKLSNQGIVTGESREDIASFTSHNQDFYNRDGKTLRFARNIPSSIKPELKKPCLIYACTVLQVQQGKGSNGTVPSHPSQGLSHPTHDPGAHFSQPGLSGPGPDMPQQDWSPAPYSLPLPSHRPC